MSLSRKYANHTPFTARELDAAVADYWRNSVLRCQGVIA